MKIVLLGDYVHDPRLGSAKVVAKLRNEFEVLGHDVWLVSAESLGSWPASRHLRELLAPVLALKAVVALVRRVGRVDVIDAASAEGFYLAGLVRLTRWPAKAVVVRSNGLEHLNYLRVLDDHREGLLFKPWWKRIWYPAVRLTQVSLSIRLSDRVIVLNKQDLSHIQSRRWKSLGDIHVVEHGVDQRFIDAAPEAGEARGKGILFCGTWTEMKGTAYLVRAFCTLIRTGHKATLTVLGPSVPVDAVLEAFPEDVRALVTVIPRVTEDEVIRQYRCHDVLVMPSSYEGFGMVLLEAMTQRLPVIASPVGAATSLIRHAETGWLVGARQSEELANTLASVLSDAALRARIADSAYAQVKHMTWLRTAAATIDVYRRSVVGAESR